MSDPTPPLLVGLTIEGWRCLVVGGGEVAARRVERLVAAGAEVTVVAPTATAAIRSGPGRWIARRFEPDDVEGMQLVVTATGIDEVDTAVGEGARRVGALFNDTTTGAVSTISFPATATTGGMRIAVTSGGRSPAFARWFARHLELEALVGVVDAVELLGEVRDELVGSGRPTTHRGWTAALDGGLLDLVRAGRRAEAGALLRRCLELPGPTEDG